MRGQYSGRATDTDKKVSVGVNVQLLPDLSAREADGDYGGWVVVVYNNDHNTVEEVIGVLIAATACSFDEAWMETWEIHNLGRSAVHHGDRAECDRVAGIIGTIGIRVEVRED